MKNLRAWILGLIVFAAIGVPVAWAVTNFSSNVCMPQPQPSDPSSANTWGTLLNTGAAIIDSITSGVTSVNVAGSSNVVLTFNCGSVDSTAFAHFNLTGVLTGNIAVLWPSGRGRMFSVTNNTTGAFTVALGANNGSGSPAGTATTIPQTYTGSYYSDGTNVLPRVTSGGMAIGANSIVGNMTSSAGPGADLAIPNCTGGLIYATGTGFGCNSGGGGGGGGTSLAFGGAPTSSFTAQVNTIYCPDTSAGGFTMTLPTTPVAGNEIDFEDCTSSFAANNFTIANNGNLLMGLNQNMTVNTANAVSRIIYIGVSYGWRLY